jgi:Protein of unknown function (DUF3039)
MSETQILEKPREKNADTGDEVFHYIDKKKTAESAVLGTPVMALCGYIFTVKKAPKPGSPVCPACKEIFDSLPK